MIARGLRVTWLRALLATLLLLVHLGAFAIHARSRYGLPFDRAPGAPPAIVDPRTQQSPRSWNRLVVSRWDAQHYINLALRGYAHCPASLRETGRLPSPPTMTCDLAFYPGYAALGRIASVAGAIPIDWALFGISLLASWIFFFLWTSAPIARALGPRATLAALLAFNTFTTGFTVVTVQTEPLVLASTVGAFVLASRRRFVLAGLAAGVAAGARITGGAVGLALCGYIVVDTLRTRPPPRELAVRALACVLGGWGGLATVGYHAIAFRDPLLYVHAHGQSYGHEPSLGALLLPKASWLLRSIDSPLHEGVFVAAALLWLALGWRAMASGFSREARAFWWVLTTVSLGIAMTGSVSRAFEGMNRYLLVAVPLFFAIGKVLERRTLALAVWVALTSWHYWNVDLCNYIGDREGGRAHHCQMAECREAR